MPERKGIWLLGAGVVIATLFALSMASDTPPPIARGTPAPPFELPYALGGSSLSLDELRGKVVLLNFWATWCKPCEDEMPAMERLYRSLAGTDFELVAVSVDEDPAAVVTFVNRMGLTFPVLWDSQQSVTADYQTFRFPESLLVGRDGVVLERYVGPKEWDAKAYVDRIRRLLAETSAG
ncbi:MAG: TlpA family protein disulfide reductase [Deltaproteobacteria bacterium]|jgi:peroxiredoxin|nr:TlpA family protein disulfide reductase [Deltaproteobacteria bacterium]MBW2543508.1 TlpA family protein disulfide reductase [Deltaproteobacteria bacterium]